MRAVDSERRREPPVIHEPSVKVIRVGWFAFEGFGRPWEGSVQRGGGWLCKGRAFTRRGAQWKALA